MIKLYKDVSASYWLVSIAGILLLCALFVGLDFGLVLLPLIPVWIFLCALIFNRIAVKRLKKIVSAAEDSCSVEECLNHLFSLHKGKFNDKIDLIIAINIAGYLLAFGKYDLCIKILQPYDPEKLFNFKSEIAYKCLYYNTLAVCYSRLYRKDEALGYLEKFGELLNSPYFNAKLKAEYEKTYKVNYLLITDKVGNAEEVLSLLKELEVDSKSLLSKVSLRFSVVVVLIYSGRADETQSDIEFIKKNGGDTIYAKCAAQNDFSKEFILEKNNEIWEPKPIKEKVNDSRIVSIIAVVLMVVLIIVVGIFTTETSYVYINERIDYEEIHTFDSNGNPESWEIECRGSSEIQNNYFSQYAHINDYDGCKAELNQDKNYFKLTIDFDKAPDEIYDVLNFPHCEDEFLDREKSDCVLNSLSRYKKFLCIEVFTGMV